MDPVEQSAHRILDILEATYQPAHRYVPARAADYRHLDLRWYDKTAELLASRGLTRLADVEDRTVTESPRTVLSAILVRSLVSRDGTVMASLYHPHLKSFWLRLMLRLLRKLPGNVTDMETECSDGSFVVTSNASMAGAIENPPMIATEYLPPATAPAEVHERHKARVAAHLGERRDATARVIRTHDDVLASQNRMNALKAAYRGEVGGITREELDRLAGRAAKPMVGDVHAGIQRERVKRAG